MSEFDKNLENQVRLEIRAILQKLDIKTELNYDHRYVITIDVTETENKLVALALSMY